MKQKLFEHSFLTSRFVEWIRIRFGAPPIISSFLFFGLPPYLTAFALWFFWGDSTLISYGFLLAFLWLALSAYLIWYGEEIANEFLEDLSKKITDKKYLDSFVKWLENTAHTDFGYLIGVPFIIVANYLSFLVYPDIHIITRIFLMVYISLLLLLAGLGFWGVFSLLRMIMRIRSIDVKTNPFDPDGFGGLEFAGLFCIKITVLFSSGSLVLPLAFEAIQKLQSANVLMLANLTVGVYVSMILLSFLGPTLALRDWFKRIKRSHLTPVAEQINSVLKKCLSSGIEADKKRFYDLISFYKQIDKMKVWPFDLPVIIKLLGSLALPIIMYFIQLNI